jgi:metal transporter CNNM
MEGEDRVAAENAKRIYPVRQNGNLLLCTLILGNVTVNSLVSIIMADKTGGLIGLLASTMAIVIFGEIIPQAACSRYALQTGSRVIPLVRVIIIIFYPVAGPLSLALNLALGEELATTYSSGEMRKLLEIHVKEGRFDHETAGAMAGALKYKVGGLHHHWTTFRGAIFFLLIFCYFFSRLRRRSW